MATVNCDYQRNSLAVKRLGDIRLEEYLNNGHKVFQFKQNVCHACNGFYGPCFGLPLCCTCHAFLYPDVACEQQGDQGWKSDSEDSGNDEPADFYEMVGRGSGQSRSVPLGPKMDKLAECISALSSARAPEATPDGVLARLPLEVLSLIFRHLDDLSLWNCSQVCRRWNQILEQELSERHWFLFAQHRWPLFKPRYHVQCWRSMYTRLVESAPCKMCLYDMWSHSPQGEENAVRGTDATLRGPMASDNSWRAVRLRHELKLLQTDPPEGIEAVPLDPLCYHWQATITGPQDSPYEGGHFYLFLQIPSAYPMKPPVVKFITKIFHPNVSRHGDIGIDSIQHNWSLALTISKVLISIQSLLTDPYCHVCMEPEVGHLYQDDRNAFERTARLWTIRYAMNSILDLSDPSNSSWRALESG